MTKLFKLMLSAMIFFSSSLSAQTEEASEYVLQAQVAMNEGEFAKAASFYESAILAGHVNGHVFYNYGIALYRQGELGASVAAFLAAERYLPRDPDVKANLKYVHAKIKDDLGYKFSKPIWTKVFFWIDALTKKEQYQLIFALMFLGGLAFALYQFQLLQSLSLWTGGGAACAALVLVMALLTDIYVVRDVGAVHGDSARAYSGPSENGNSVVFEVSEGSPLQILETQSAWSKVALSDGKRGWIANDKIRVY